MATYEYTAEVRDGDDRMLDSAEGQITVSFSFYSALTISLVRRKLMRELRTPGIAITWLEAYGMDSLEGRDPNRKVTIVISRVLDSQNIWDDAAAIVYES